MTALGVPAGQQTVRRHNLGLISTALAGGPSSRAELAQRTGLTKATVSSLVDHLIARRIVVEGEPAATGVGRPARPVRLDPDGPVALGVEINVDYLAACVLDLTGALRCYRHRPVANRARDRGRHPGAGGGAGRSGGRRGGQPLLGGGLALPGVVGADGTVLRAPNLPSLTGTAARPAAGRRARPAGAAGRQRGQPGGAGELACRRRSDRTSSTSPARSGWAPAWWWRVSCSAGCTAPPASSGTWW